MTDKTKTITDKTENKLTTEVVNRILGINDSYKAPARLMEILFNREERERVFREFLDVDCNLDKDCFHVYFQEEHAERKKYAQDFTPKAVGDLLSALIGVDIDRGACHLDVAAGTGGLTIQKWVHDKYSTDFFQYKPSMFFYQCEELSDRTVPFLLFNMLIRGMNGTVVHGDVLTREIKDVYFIQNWKDSYIAFSDLNVMPRTSTVEQEFSVNEWIGEPVRDSYIESENVPEFLGGNDLLKLGEFFG